jgi:hypothetical protein
MMPHNPAQLCTAFRGHALLAAGPLIEVALAVKAALDQGPAETVLMFDDATGGLVDIDLRGGRAEIEAWLAEAGAGPAETERRGRGRPKLGVVAREVTLLPRHWEWLEAQPGGASVTLRRLVEAARRGADRSGRGAREAAYRFMSALAGDLPGFEEASRALFAGDRPRLEAEIAAWPADLRDYALALAFANPADPIPE